MIPPLNADPVSPGPAVWRGNGQASDPHPVNGFFPGGFLALRGALVVVVSFTVVVVGATVVLVVGAAVVGTTATVGSVARHRDSNRARSTIITRATTAIRACRRVGVDIQFTVQSSCSSTMYLAYPPSSPTGVGPGTIARRGSVRRIASITLAPK